MIYCYNFSDEPKPSLPQKKQKPTRIASSDGGTLAQRTTSKNRGGFQLYQFFQRKERERKNKFQKLNSKNFQQ